MKKSKTILFMACFSANMAFQHVHAGDIQESAQNEGFANPSIITGFNPDTKNLTGYVSLSRPAPGSIDWCNFLFYGKVDGKQAIPVSLKNVVKDEGRESIAQSRPSTQSKGKIEISSGKNILLIEESELPGACTWMFPAAGVAGIAQAGTTFSVRLGGEVKGSWIAVGVISSKRAHFHAQPDEKTIKKAFLISGNVLYIYKEENDWLYVKFQGLNKETYGWIKKSDTVQLVK
ncbi:hypothetical protein [Janthinobacterium agaricidamnosum]|uniref:SH3b domain-containing protein n=1 Tax=Janthinobacterium agaricidamnosum NBRC 102515 = DSM 9628 TaxID=1349767 RepID=W0V2W1_9BURK|nr:hypothetical protein [Janthinobacterium agaricidamnosum]CDG83169.1 hypothetical protein GJA_2538 [Janthinobacterium agaricidamnosum NBRC 102515 = DSM 9628]